MAITPRKKPPVARKPVVKLPPRPPTATPPPFMVDGVTLRKSVSDAKRAAGIRAELEMTDSKGTTMTFDLTERGLLTVIMSCQGG